MAVDSNLKKIDIGCGSNKKEGCIGIDLQRFDNVDIVLDVTKEKIPLDDRSVCYIYSSHFFEHIKSPDFIFSEISRVAIAGALLEIWTPYAHSDDAFCFGHVIFFTEEHWKHMCVNFPDFYYPILNARWLLKKIVYVIEPTTRSDIEKQGFDIEFAIKYFKGVVKEIGVFIEIKHEKEIIISLPQKYYTNSRNDEFILIE